MQEHETSFRRIFRAFKDAQLVSPRGQLIKELENFSYTLPPFVRFQSFECRKFNLSYVKNEMMWYLKGERFDTSITQHAKLWQSIINEDGSINSNYGQYIFHGDDNQFDNVVKTLSLDKDSRRASIMILNSSHLLSDTKDVPCTYSLNFRIRNNRLNMSVHMRSQDAIFGMGNDAPAFSFIHEMLLNALRETYPELQYGSYFHVADSFHVYERHFQMLDQICNGSTYQFINCPEISGCDEVRFLRSFWKYNQIPEKFNFTKWLVNV